MPDISLYRLRGGRPLRDYVDPDAFEDEPIALDDPERMLWRRRIVPVGAPAWAPLVAGGFPGQEFDERPEREVAVIVVRVLVYGRRGTWAVVFGQGIWQSLRHHDRAAHDIAAAQLLYDDASGTLKGLKKVVAGEIRKQAGTITRQLTDASPLAAFDFDEYGQAFLAVTAKAPEPALGRTMTSGNSIHLTAIKGWGELLGAIAVLELAVQRGTAAGVRLPGLVREADPPKAVRDALAALVRGNGTGVAVALSADEAAQGLRLSDVTTATTGIEDYGITDLRADLSAARIRVDLDYDTLSSLLLHEIHGDGQVPIFRRLIATVTNNDIVWALADGEWWRMPAGWIPRLNENVRKINVLDYIALDRHACRGTDGNVQEGLYNARLAAALPNATLLDKQTLRDEGITSGIEVADLISVQPGTGGENTIDVIANKRGLGSSSSLSHLFTQVRAAAGALEDDATRAAFVRRIVNVHVPVGAVRNSILDVLEAEPFEPSRVRFVLGIAGDWRGQEPVDAIPVLARTSIEPLLRRLRAAGFGVAIARIDETPGATTAGP
jgi:hypothetical protein